MSYDVGHRVTRRLPGGVLRYQPTPNGAIEYEKGEISLWVRPDGGWKVLGDGVNNCTMANARDVAACLLAAAAEAEPC